MMDSPINHRFLYRSPLWRALLEAALAGLALAIFLSFVQIHDQNFLYTLGAELAIVCSAVCALRVKRMEERSFRKYVFELRNLLALFLLLVALNVSLWMFAWSFQTFSFPNFLLINGFSATFLMAVVYCAVRLGVRLWLKWEDLCRRKMAWQLTRAQFGFVLLLIALAGFLVMLLVVGGVIGQYLYHPEAPGLMLGRINDAAFSTLGLVILFASPFLLVVLPIFALFSYWFVRRTTHRLDDLVVAADAFRRKAYDTRVVVSGQDEVAHLQDSFNKMAADLSQTLNDLQLERDKVKRLVEERQELFASVSHELRTPASIIRLEIESIQSRKDLPAAADLQRDLQTIEHQTARLQTLLEDLFLLSNAEVGKLTLNCQPVSTSEIAGRVVNQMAPLFWNKNRVQLECQAEENEAPAWADSQRLEQAVLNLVRNAARFTPPGGMVLIQTLQDKDHVLVRVRDTGSGISVEDLPHIWERYYRAQNEDDNQELNVGLGLPLVKELVEAMGGSVGVESQPGEGSCFTLTLQKAASSNEASKPCAAS